MVEFIIIPRHWNSSLVNVALTVKLNKGKPELNGSYKLRFSLIKMPKQNWLKYYHLLYIVCITIASLDLLASFANTFLIVARLSFGTLLLVLNFRKARWLYIQSFWTHCRWLWSSQCILVTYTAIPIPDSRKYISKHSFYIPNYS